MKRLKICASRAGEGGVAFYRIIQPYTYLEKYFDIFIYNPNQHSPKRLEAEMEDADILVYQMPWGEYINNIVKTNSERDKPKKIIIEMDDNIFDTNPFNSAYAAFGTQEIETTIFDKPTIDAMLASGAKGVVNKDGSVRFPMWVKHDNEFDPEKNLKAAINTQLGIAGADLVTVTCPELKKRIQKYRPDKPIQIIPNLLDMARWLPMKENDTKDIRIGWQGGQAHMLDLLTISPVLDKILVKYPQVKLVFKGGVFWGMYNTFPKDRIEVISWHGDINTYPLEVRDMKLDIGIAPLIPDRFNQCKSNLKWLEYSALKIPGVYSDTCYAGSVNHGKTGFIARTQDDWFKYLSELIESEQLRKEIAEKAFNRVSKYHNLEQLDTYINVWHKVGLGKQLYVPGLEVAA